MPDASYLQTSFLGGEWSPLVQGRMDDPKYRTGMNVCRNVMPLEEGAASRRPGTRGIAATRNGAYGVLRAFDFAQANPYLLELTEGHIRLLAGNALVLESAGLQPIIGLSTTNPVQVQTAGPHGWVARDQVQVNIDPDDPANATIAALLGRELEIAVIDTTHFTVVDSLTKAPIDGTAMILGSTNLTVARVADFITTFKQPELDTINTVQSTNDFLLLHGKHAPYDVKSVSAQGGAVFASFQLGNAVFKDGPYLDPPTDLTTITSSGLSGSVTLTLAGGATRFAKTDVNRLTRLLSEPAAWAIATAYIIGAQVKFNGEYYQAVKASTGKQPDTDIINWAVATGAAAWTWAQITAFTDSTHVTATIMGDPILRTTPCATWRLGLFSDTTGYPTCGTYHEGRLILAGIIGNRFDGSKSNDPFNFAPTGPDGTVADDNAIAAVFNAKDVNQIFWMEPDEKGIVMGTQAGEWLVQASAQNDPLTPTSIQAHRVTQYGCANVPARRAGSTLAFVQRYNKKVMEYITTDFRGVTAQNISVTGKHLTQTGILELAYQREKVPVLWARTAAGQLIGCTYKRESPYASDPPVFSGWHRHDLGSGMTVTSIQVGPNYDGTLDALSMVVTDGAFYYSQLLTDMFDIDWQIGDSFFVDFAWPPKMWEIIAGSPQILRLYSLHRLAGKAVDIFVGGVDAGTITVGANGTLDVPLTGLLTTAYLGTLSSASNFHSLGLAITVTPTGIGNNPTVTGIQNFDTSLLAIFSPGVSTVDWVGHRMFSYDATNNKLLVNDTQTFKPILGPFSTPILQQLTFAEDGYLYGVTPATNCATLQRVDPQTGAVLASFGLASGAFPTDATHWAYPNDYDTVAIGNRHFLVSTPQSPLQAGSEIAILDLDGMAWTGNSPVTTDLGISVVCRGKKSKYLGKAHVLTQQIRAFAGTSTLLGFYTVSIVPMPVLFAPPTINSIARVATIQATQIGAAWTHIDFLFGMLCDDTDGNVIAHVQSQLLPAYNAGTTYLTGNGVSSAGHEYKSLQNANTGNTPAFSPAFWTDLGAIMWSNVILNTISGSQRLNDSRVRYGKYVFLDTSSFGGGNYHLWQINTLTGAMTNQVIFNVPSNFQFYDDYSGQFIGNISYVAGGGAPLQIGTTPASFTSWASFGPAAGPAVPAAAPPSAGVFWTTPVAIGYTYTSQGQILRAVNPQEAGSRNGPALGKTRRTHMYSALLQQTQGIKFGTTFDHLRTAQLQTKGKVPFALTSLYSNVHQDTLDDTYSFDSMVCWQIDRPYPASVLALGPDLHTQDR
jgi:hypothetical protein